MTPQALLHWLELDAITNIADVFRWGFVVIVVAVVVFLLSRDWSLRSLRNALQTVQTGLDEALERIGALETEVRTLRRTNRLYGCRRALDCEDHLPFVDDVLLEDASG